MHSQQKQIFALTVVLEAIACQNASCSQFSFTTVSYFSIPNENQGQEGNPLASYFMGTRFKCSPGECIIFDFIHSCHQRLKLHYNCFLPHPLPFIISSFNAAVLHLQPGNWQLMCSRLQRYSLILLSGSN